MSAFEHDHNGAMEVAVEAGQAGAPAEEGTGVSPILEGSAPEVPTAGNEAFPLLEDASGLEVPAEVRVPAQQHPTGPTPCEETATEVAAPSPDAGTGPLRGVQVIVCAERGHVMVAVARWRVFLPATVSLCEGDGVGLAYLERVVKAERERRGL